jgi:hypothetical protein
LMLEGYLKALGAHQVQQLIFAGDGALWIWERTGPLANALGLAPEGCVPYKGSQISTREREWRAGALFEVPPRHCTRN